MKKVLLIFGTRPEAIKMAPLYLALSNQQGVDVRIVVTAQHREMLDQVLDLFGVVPDYDLNTMNDGQGLFDLTASMLTALEPILEQVCPDIVLVHGDTTTSLVGALASYYKKVKVAHVEAGLRTGNIYSPWPEELNRKIVGGIAQLHFAPTKQAKDNLIKENVPLEDVHITGNTIIDALFYVVGKLRKDKRLRIDLDKKLKIDKDKRLILVTSHRRENFGNGLANICSGLKKIAQRAEVQILLPVHPNPSVKKHISESLKGQENIVLLPPLDYLSFVHAMERCSIILTDSGGVQEEAPSLGKPVLVMRDTTERPEALIAGTAMLIGSQEENIVNQTTKLLENEHLYNVMAQANNPYGDGEASRRIAELLQ